MNGIGAITNDNNRDAHGASIVYLTNPNDPSKMAVLLCAQIGASGSCKTTALVSTITNFGLLETSSVATIAIDGDYSAWSAYRLTIVSY